MECRRSEPGALPGGARSRAPRRDVGRGMAAIDLRRFGCAAGMRPARCRPARRAPRRTLAALRSRAAEAEPAPLSVRGARLSDTVAKLNARLEQMTAGRPGAPALLKPRRRPRRSRQSRTSASSGHRSGGRRNRCAPARAGHGTEQTVAPASTTRPLLNARIRGCARAAPDFASLERQLHTSPGRSRRCASRPASRMRSPRSRTRPRRHRARRQRGAAAPRARKPAERRATARRADRARLRPRRRPVRAREHRAQPCRGARARSTR